MNYYLEGLSNHDDNKWFALTKPGLFEPTYCYMLRLSKANPGYKYRIKSINRLS